MFLKSNCFYTFYFIKLGKKNHKNKNVWNKKKQKKTVTVFSLFFENNAV